MPDGNVSYTLQVFEEESDNVWVDVATVAVPRRTKHRTAILKALKAGGVEVPEDGLEVRLLAGEMAEPIRVLPPPREPGPRELRL